LSWYWSAMGTYSLIERLWVAGNGAKVKVDVETPGIWVGAHKELVCMVSPQGREAWGHVQSRVTRTNSSRDVMPMFTSLSPSSRIKVMPPARAAVRISASEAWW